MTARARPRLVGLFVIVAVILALVGIAALSSGKLFAEYRTYVVVFRGAVGGLKPGAQVTFRQVPVGQVRDIDLLLTGQGVDMRIVAIIEIRRGAVRSLVGEGQTERQMSDAALIQRLLSAGLRAGVRSSSPIAGQKSIDLDFHPDLEARFSGLKLPYPEIPTAPTGMELINEKIDSALKKLSEVPIDDVLLQLRGTLESVQMLVESGDVKGAMQNLRLALETANRTLGGVEKTMDNVDGMVGDVRGTLGNLDKTVSSLKTSLDKLDSTLATVDRNVERTADVQHQATRTFDQLEELSKSLRFLIDTLQQHPEALLLGKEEAKEKK